LARVKQYFAKITEAETGASKRGSTLDKPAAGRFIKHALVLPLSFTVLCKRDVALIGDDKAGNEIYDRKRAQQQADEKARAHIRFEETSNKRKLEDTAISSTAANSQLIGAKSSPMNLEGSSASISTQASPALDRPAEGSSVEHASNHDNGTMVPEQKSKKKRKKRPSKQERAEKLGVSKGEN
jgi:exosome complex protein LRP1